MADWHRINIRTSGNQWVSEEIPAGTRKEAMETAAARWPGAKKVEWSGTCQSPQDRAASESNRARAEQEQRDHEARWREQSARGQAPDPVDNGGGYSGGGGSSGGSDDGDGCGALGVIFGGLAAISVASVAFHTVTAPLRWIGIMPEPAATGPSITFQNCARYLTATECADLFPGNRDENGRITGAQPVDLEVQRGICISAFDNGGMAVVSAIEAQYGYDCEAAMAAGH